MKVVNIFFKRVI